MYLTGTGLDLSLNVTRDQLDGLANWLTLDHSIPDNMIYTIKAGKCHVEFFDFSDEEPLPDTPEAHGATYHISIAFEDRIDWKPGLNSPAESARLT